MRSVYSRINEQAVALPEGTPLCPSALLHLGTRTAVDQALSRLARDGRLLRICQGVYMRPIQTRFGTRPPALEKIIVSLAALWGEVIVPCGGSSANVLGLTTQVPVESIYLTSGNGRRLRLGALTVRLRHAPRWQLVAPNRLAGDVVRALAWLGPGEAEGALKQVAAGMSAEDLAELADARAVLPAWIAGPVSDLVAHG